MSSRGGSRPGAGRKPSAKKLARVTDAPPRYVTARGQEATPPAAAREVRQPTLIDMLGGGAAHTTPRHQARTQTTPSSASSSLHGSPGCQARHRCSNGLLLLLVSNCSVRVARQHGVDATIAAKAHAGVRAGAGAGAEAGAGAGAGAAATAGAGAGATCGATTTATAAATVVVI